MPPIPHEFNFHGIYLAPLLVAALYGVLTTCLVALLLNRYRVSRYLASPPLVFVALCAFFTCIIGTFIIPS